MGGENFWDLPPREPYKPSSSIPHERRLSEEDEELEAQAKATLAAQKREEVYSEALKILTGPTPQWKKGKGYVLTKEQRENLKKMSPGQLQAILPQPKTGAPPQPVRSPGPTQLNPSQTRPNAASPGPTIPWTRTSATELNEPSSYLPKKPRSPQIGERKAPKSRPAEKQSLAPGRQQAQQQALLTIQTANDLKDKFRKTKTTSLARYIDRLLKGISSITSPDHLQQIQSILKDPDLASAIEVTSGIRENASLLISRYKGLLELIEEKLNPPA